MRKALSVCILLFAVLFLHRDATANSALDSARKSLVHKVVLLKHPASGTTIHFDAAGSPPPDQNGFLGSDGVLYIQRIDATGQSLEIRADRVIFVYPGVDPLRTEQHVTLQVDISNLSDVIVRKALAALLQSGAGIDRFREYLKLADKKDFHDLTDAGKPLGSLGGFRPIYGASPKFVKDAVAVSAPDPEYSEDARKRKISGELTVGMVVNENGVPEVLRLEDSLNPELDTNALKAAAAFRFRPATRDGQPVASFVKVSFGFHLY